MLFRPPLPSNHYRRGLLEGLESSLNEGFSLLLGLMESFSGFVIARSCLDFALARQWLDPFGSER